MEGTDPPAGQGGEGGSGRQGRGSVKAGLGSRPGSGEGARKGGVRARRREVGMNSEGEWP